MRDVLISLKRIFHYRVLFAVWWAWPILAKAAFSAPAMQNMKLVDHSKQLLLNLIMPEHPLLKGICRIIELGFYPNRVYPC
jgi:hypothetical protein